jgi:hypothetical protein
MVDYCTDQMRYVDGGFPGKVHFPLIGVVRQITAKE